MGTRALTNCVWFARSYFFGNKGEKEVDGDEGRLNDNNKTVHTDKVTMQ